MNLHILFCPKYRPKCLTDNVAKRWDELLGEKCAELDCEVSVLEIMPDHAHLFVAVTPDLAPNHIVAPVNGYTSRVLRQEFPHLLKAPSLWTHSNMWEPSAMSRRPWYKPTSKTREASS